MANYSDRNVLFKDIDNGRLGIGVSPSTEIHARNTSANSNVLVRSENDADYVEIGIQGTDGDKGKIKHGGTDVVEFTDSTFAVQPAGTITSSDLFSVVGIDNSYAASLMRMDCFRAENSAFNFIECRADTDGSPTTPFLVRGDGRVGIGVSSPDDPLHVNGSVRVSNHIYTGRQTLQTSGVGTHVLDFTASQMQIPYHACALVNVSTNFNGTNYGQATYHILTSSSSTVAATTTPTYFNSGFFTASAATYVFSSNFAYPRITIDQVTTTGNNDVICSILVFGRNT